ncbi:MAG: hypothetical protein AAFZ87_09825 [Planctomycetota bacterium]
MKSWNPVPALWLLASLAATAPLPGCDIELNSSVQYLGSHESSMTVDELSRAAASLLQVEEFEPDRPTLVRWRGYDFIVTLRRRRGGSTIRVAHSGGAAALYDLLLRLSNRSINLGLSDIDDPLHRSVSSWCRYAVEDRGDVEDARDREIRYWLEEALLGKHALPSDSGVVGKERAD